MNDNCLQPKQGETGFDKLYKLRPMLDTLSATFQNHYRPNEQQSIDESMVRFKGRIGFRQYVPKTSQRGDKIWIRADQSSFVSQLQIYTGKRDGGEEGLSSRVDKDFTRVLVEKHHKVFFDNFFTTITLLNDLFKDNIYACEEDAKTNRNI